MPKKIVCRELGRPESLQLETFASAPLAPGEVRVAIHAAGINFPDVLMAAGEYQLKPPLPFTPAWPNRSYRDRLSPSLSTSNASLHSLKRARHSSSPGFLSG